MVEVLGPWLVPVEAVVSEPTAGARMKSMSPSVDNVKTQFCNVTKIVDFTQVNSSLRQERLRLTTTTMAKQIKTLRRCGWAVTRYQ